MKSFVSLCFFLILLRSVSYSQPHPSLENFEVFTIDNKVALRWTMKPGNTCLGIGILRSVDEIAFDQIGIIGGVCGSPDKAVNYTFIDSFPVSNAPSYYKLVLGLLGESHVVPYRFIDFTKQKALVSPNPMKGHGVITFASEPVEEALFCLYTAEGALLYSGKIRHTNQIDLHAIGYWILKSGTVLFSVTTLSGKIISTGSFVTTE